MQSHPEEQDEDRDYNSASDEDFDPQDAADAGEGAGSSDDEEGSTAVGSKKRKAAGEAEDIGFDNSGDEATVRKGKRKSKKKKKKQKDDDAEDDQGGGDGGLIKTRSQRFQETKEKKPLVQTGKATVDIDDLWAKMSAPTPHAPRHEAPKTSIPEQKNELRSAVSDAGLGQGLSEQKVSPALVSEARPNSDSGMVTIKRTYEFAGKTEQEERLVPIDSAEAKLYLAEQNRIKEQDANHEKNGEAKPGLRKVMKRKSMFAGTGAPQGQGYGAPVASQGPKLNTLQKSRLDWAQQVDKEGIAEELDEHSRAKDSYASRMDFLGRMEAKREHESRRSQ